MDPQACLQRILNAVRDNDRSEYVAACEDLAGWLRSGGFAPIVPAGTPYIPGTNTAWSLLSPVGDRTYMLVRWDSRGNSAEAYELMEAR